MGMGLYRVKNDIKLKNVKTNCKIKNIRYLYRGINDFCLLMPTTLFVKLIFFMTVIYYI